MSTRQGEPSLWATAQAAALPPQDIHSISLPVEGRCFNPSLLRWGGRWLLAYRHREQGARLRLAWLDESMRVTRDLPIELPEHPDSIDGQEDPRLFHFRGELWLAYAALRRWPSRNRIMLARIAVGGEVLEHIVPELPQRQPREKNWLPYEQEGRLWAVYHGSPHRLLRIGLDGQSELATSHPNPLASWAYGAIRGGAPPVLAEVSGGDAEWYHFFHSFVRREHQRPLYCLGLYTFAARSPWQVTRVARAPLYVPLGDPPDRHVPYVVFPGGAVIDGDRWLIAAGRWDRECIVLEYDRAAIEARLETVPT